MSNSGIVTTGSMPRLLQGGKKKTKKKTKKKSDKETKKK